jgi:DNA-binding CsgD family transcriptional regulator
MQEQLTSREQEIFNMLLDNITPKEIAYNLKISYFTVNFHRDNIYKKLGVHNFRELLAKYGSAGQSAEAAISAEPETSLYISIKVKRSMLRLLLRILVFAAFAFFILRLLIKPSVPGHLTSLASAKNPLTLILNDNEPWGYEVFFSPFVLNNVRITAGDIYTYSYSFVSNVDIELIYSFFVDRTEEADFYTFLSSNAHIKGKVKANIVYNCSGTIITTKTASSTDPNANLFCISTKPYTYEQPTLTFSKFEITKSN